MMNDRDRALATLRHARTLLAVKITDMVNANEHFAESLVDDWSDESEQVLDFGERLRRLNQVIDSLPREPVPTTNSADTFFNPSLGEPYKTLSLLPTWDEFVVEVNANHLDEAAVILASLAQIDTDTARRATDVFAEQAWTNPEFAAKANSLRAQLNANMQGSLNLIRELFGIGGKLAVQIYHSLRVAV